VTAAKSSRFCCYCSRFGFTIYGSFLYSGCRAIEQVIVVDTTYKNKFTATTSSTEKDVRELLSVVSVKSRWGWDPGWAEGKPSLAFLWFFSRLVFWAGWR
jgi:hypothetical protein